MFGPNYKKKLVVDIDCHHREERFYSIIKEIKSIFRQKFEIPNEYEIVLINGSGTFAMESVISSIGKDINPVGFQGKFLERWSEYCRYYNKYSSNGVKLAVQFETSESIYNSVANNAYIVDGVCAFPYYTVPSNCSIYVTVTSKLLGAAPVLGVVLIRKTEMKSFEANINPGSLNLLKWIEYTNQNQTPFTPSIPLYLDFLRTLENFDLEYVRGKIDYISDKIVEILGRENIIGDPRGPAITVCDNVIPDEIIKRYRLYGSEVIGKKKLQIFTYSENEKIYDSFFNDLRKYRKY
jgi:aspartate aminotransferase-like enzyme